MELNTAWLDNKIFAPLAKSSNRRYACLCNLETRVSRWSQSAVDYFGLPGEYVENVAELWLSLLHPDDVDLFCEKISELRAGRLEHRPVEFRMRNPRGGYDILTGRGSLIPPDEATGAPALFAGTLVNHGVADYVDPGTNLYNAYGFMNAMRQVTETPELVMLLGFNRFDTINKVYGYGFGNAVMATYGNLLLERVRNRGMVYRLGDDSLGLRLPMMENAEAIALYQEFQQIARNGIVVRGQHIPMSISGGAMVVDSSCEKQRIRACLTDAREESEGLRHSELVFFQAATGGKSLKALSLLETIRTSVLRDCQGFFLCYQPLVAAQTGEIVGMEALVRWAQAPYGTLSPGEFIPWLEQDDCFFELGNWILRQAMLDGREIVARHPEFMVNVNVTYSQLENSRFQDSLQTILLETGFPAKNLYLELTERFQPTDMDNLRQTLLDFSHQGIKIALDDFGTGTASLNMLRRLPIDCLKVDRAFLTDVQTEPQDEIILRTVIDSANLLGIRVCLEGIETQSLRDYVQKYQVNTHQGYYYSRPVPFPEFQTLMNRASA